MITIHLVLLILAFMCLLMQALNVQAQRITLGWLGLALFILDLLVK